MLPQDTPLPILSMSAWLAWLDSPAGRYMLAWEQAKLDEWVADLFGYNALQVGLPQLDALRQSRMTFAAFVGDGQNPISNLSPWAADWHGEGSPTANGPEAPWRALRHQVLSHFEELPFRSHSVDLLVLPHALEFATEPHQVLREVERVLIPDGRVIVVGFNPWSLWGLRQRGLRPILGPYLPREGHFLPLSRLKDWLKLLSFEFERVSFGCYAWPCQSEKWLKRVQWMDQTGSHWWPVGGAVYMICAVKRVRALRLIEPKWKRRLSPAPAAVAGARRGLGLEAAEP